MHPTNGGDSVLEYGLKALAAAGAALRDTALKTAGAVTAQPGKKASPHKQARAKPPPAPTRKELKGDELLRELAKWPHEAHEKWKRLSGSKQVVVLIYMAGNYGKTFASRFLTHARSGSSKSVLRYYGRGISFITPEKLKKGGYELAHRDVIHEWWVHPSGKITTRVYSMRTFGESGQEEAIGEEKSREDDVPDAEQEDLATIQEQMDRFELDLGKFDRELRELKSMASELADPTNDKAYCDKFRKFEADRMEFIDDEYNNEDTMRQNMVVKDPDRPRRGEIIQKLDTYKELIRQRNGELITKWGDLPLCEPFVRAGHYPQ